ncbi:MAG: glycoside hydrolase family 38 C-terminal domain-containing protein [Acidobacteriaceae bacterium]
MINRRKFIEGVVLSSAGNLRLHPAFARDGSAPPILYYMDGYHGGVRGHMPAGCWRDILSALREFPDWKLSFDVEPSSWKVLRQEDPQAYEELAGYLKNNTSNSRTEMVGGTFAQPYGWAISGESNIRQLQRGLQIIREHFPDSRVVTYAVQEPCWASCLPQILRSLGFDGAVLKDASTAWCGYAAGWDADLVEWAGPDGTPIAAVPRYAMEKLQKVYETESIDGTLQFAQRCIAHHIAHPAGMCFQDLGWPAKPKVSGSYIRFATWQEYIHGIADRPRQTWHFSMEDILVTLPWGDATLQKVAQQVRYAEDRLVAAEKIAAMAAAKCGAMWPQQQLVEAWDRLLLSQAHDAWITATTRSGRQAWAFQVASDTLSAQQAADEIIATAAVALSSGGPAGQPQIPLESQWVRVINSLAFARNDLAQLTLATDPSTSQIEVTDRNGNAVPAQMIATRKYLPPRLLNELSQTRTVAPDRNAMATQSDLSVNTAIVLISAQAPSMGYTSYLVKPVYGGVAKTAKTNTFARTEPDGSVTLESDLYRIKIDPKRGGAITSLFLKQAGREFSSPDDDRLFNEYRGYFIAQQAWFSSTDQSAQVTLSETGPLRATVDIRGKIGDAVYETRISLVEGQRRIDFNVRLLFEQDTWIGDPWDIAAENRRSEPRRSQNDGRWKLQAFFPVALSQPTLYKNAAFDVCRSRNADTFFQRWDEIKHNIIVNWVDLVDRDEHFGLALISDHTTAYTHGPSYPLALVLGWAWEGGFWWGKHPLRGEQQVSYGIIPHQGRGDQALISQEHNRYSEPLVTQLVAGDRSEPDFSLIQINPAGVEVSTMLIESEHTLIRLFNAESSQVDHVVSFANRPAKVQVVELDGRPVRDLKSQEGAGGRHEVRLEIPRFGLRTLKCRF